MVSSEEQAMTGSPTAPTPSPSTEPKCKRCLDSGRCIVWDDAGARTGWCGCTIGQSGELAENWTKAGVPERFRYMTLATSPVDTSIKGKLAWHDPTAEWTTEDQDRWSAFADGSWLFWGDYGVGKTGLAVAYASERFKHNEYPPTLRFVSVPDFLSELRDTYRADGGSEMAIIKSYREPDILILDDLGAEHVKDSGWLEDRLYQLIGHRHADQRQTIFTSNLSPSQLGDRIGERNMWRIIEMCGDEHILHITGPNLRDKRSKAAS